MVYNVTWLIDKFERGDTIQYIFFWGHSNKGNEGIGRFVFSQWYSSPFVVDNVEYKTAEHWMMAQKANLFGDTQILQEIVQAETPGEAKHLGRMVRGFDEIKWKEKRFEIVRTGNIHKFHQNKNLRDFLMATKDHVLVEASPTDVIWGIGLSQDSNVADMPHAWQGENLLGFALMEARDLLIRTGDFSYTATHMVPPWKKAPGVDPMFWRMGSGEQYITDLAEYFNSLSDRDKMIYKLTFPAPGDWTNFYTE